MEEVNDKKKLIIGIIIGILLVGLIGGFIYFKQRTITLSEIATFEECAKAGYPILETYPRQCQAPDGRLFSEEIAMAPTESEQICADLCGDGICQEIVCLAIGCPCPETLETCPLDCKKETKLWLIK